MHACDIHAPCVCVCVVINDLIAHLFVVSVS